MPFSYRRLVSTAGPLILVALTAQSPSFAQASKTPAPVRQVGFEGYWIPQGIATGAVVEGGSEAAVTGRRSRDYKSPIVDPLTGEIPWRAEASAKYRELRDKIAVPQLDYIDPVARCLPAGVPRVMYVTPYNGYQFIQTPGYVLIIAEWNHHYRIVPLDGRPHLPANMKLWMGDPRGRWEGNVLVIETTNNNGRTWFQIVGGIQSDAMRVVERFSIIDANTLRYRVTIEDSTLFTQPWTMEGRFIRANVASGKPDEPIPLGSGFSDSPREGYELFEYACHEGNRSMEAIMPKQRAP